MSAVLLFLAVIAAISGWWLRQQRLTAKPWLEQGTQADFPRTNAVRLPPAKIGLGVFLAVAGCLFALLISAYIMRVDLDSFNFLGGVPRPVPKLLWLNTGVLVCSSVALQWAWVEARRGHMDAVRSALLIGAVSATAFVAGQLLAWRQMTQAGYFLTSSPVTSFFYLLTGIHGLHVLGGLVALRRSVARAWGGAATAQLRLSVELCAIYWHFLLLVWLILFSFVMGWADSFAAICHTLIT